MKQRFIIVLSLLLCCTFSWADDPSSVPIPALVQDVWASYSPSYNVEVPRYNASSFPVKVYTAVYDEYNALLTTHELNGNNSVVIGVGDGYLLKATDDIEEGAYNLNTSDNSPASDANSLQGTSSETTRAALIAGEARLMVLKKNTSTFIEYIGDYFPSNKAYLLISPYSAPSIRIVEESETVTTLDNCAEDAERSVKLFRNGQLYIVRDGITYDLMGRTIR